MARVMEDESNEEDLLDDFRIHDCREALDAEGLGVQQRIRRTGRRGAHMHLRTGTTVDDSLDKCVCSRSEDVSVLVVGDESLDEVCLLLRHHGSQGLVERQLLSIQVDASKQGRRGWRGW